MPARSSTPMAAVVMPTPSSHVDVAQARMNRFRELARYYDIRDDFAVRMRALEGKDIVFVCDDSGSMQTPGSLRVSGSDAFAVRATRWDELRHTTNMVAQFASVMDPDGIDVYFLNRGQVGSVTDPSQLEPWFATAPYGSTPLVNTLRRVFADKAKSLAEREVFVYVVTDGVPDEGIPALREALLSMPASAHVTILACTNERSVLSQLQTLDEGVPRVDVLDDYDHEREEVLKAQGKGFAFSFGDYIMKAMLGALDPYMDALDEASTVPIRRTVSGRSARGNGCCVVA